MKHEFTGTLKQLIDRAASGTPSDVDYVMGFLTNDATLAMTRYVDFALSQVNTCEGINRIKYYLFNGSQIQRNYATLFLSRIGEWKDVVKAFEMGLIDEIQAFAR